jgi:small subunit ribosomal protein S17
MVGTVTSDKMDKTVVVAVEVSRTHRLYGRTIRRTHKFKAHDERNQYHPGDIVEVREARPLSREKRWVVTRLLKSGQEEIPIADPTVTTTGSTP